MPGNWLQFVIGVLDLIIAWMLIGSGPAASVTLVTAIVGIEMLVSSFALFQAANLFKRAGSYRPAIAGPIAFVASRQNKAIPLGLSGGYLHR